MISSKLAIVFGETHFVISCLEYLLEKNWSISAVVTQDIIVTSWCKKHYIPNLTIDQAFEIKESNCYLFSIINPYILSTDLLEHLKPVKSINYHDSLLPKYAGINSTTWAILNNETFHGISWHEITQGIDEGDIYYNTTIRIDENDTAFDLNLKCTQAALFGFIEIIKNIEQEKLIGLKQDLSKKTYFERDYIPDNYAYINSTDNFFYINKLLNGLNFGDKYINSVATVKIRIHSKNYIIEKKFSTNSINEINLSNCIIRNMYGTEITNSTDFTEIQNYNLSVNELNHFKEIKKKELAAYNKINNFINRVEINGGLLSSLLSSHKEKVEVQIDTSINQLCTFLSIILNRLNSNKTFIKIYHKINSISLSSLIEEITEQVSVLMLESESLNLSYFDILHQVTENVVNNKFHLTKDFGYRYKTNLCSEFAIVDDYIECVDEHKVIFYVQQEKIVIEFYKEEVYFINVIANCIKLLSDKVNASEMLDIKTKYIFLLSDADYQKVVYDWNANNIIVENSTIHSLFEEQVLNTPHNIAVVCKGKKLTYKKLNNMANQLANYLKSSYNIQEDALLALCMDKSEWMLVTILAILKTGGGYVPIDPNYPDERINYILQDAGVTIIFTNKIYASRLFQLTTQGASSNNIDIKIEIIDDAKTQMKFNKNSSNNLVQSIRNKNLAYVIYTSGTTGKPKGVMIEHASVVNYLMNIKERLFSDNKEHVDFSTNIGFDLTVTTMFGSLCFGHELYIYSENVKDLKHYKKHLIDNKITLIKVVPSYFELLVKMLSETKITTVILGGEKIFKSTIERIHVNDLTIYDEYGPTESTVGSCLACIYINGQKNNFISIGTAYNNYKIYILDLYMNLLPLGAVGELYIGGTGLARGYLNDLTLTEAKFISNPYQSQNDKLQGINDKLYKTGDKVKYLPDGNLEYIGRIDSQFKINGFRIEPKEIESVINCYPNIKQSIVVTNKQLNSVDAAFNEYLVAYYISAFKLDESSLLNYLTQQFPFYMVPEVLIHITEIPLTINGKLDKQALPGPNFTFYNNYIAPRNNLESKICDIYSEVLKLSPQEIGINHDFFKLGGNSISAIHLVYKLQNELKINLNDVYKFKTPAKIAESVPFAKDNLRHKLKQRELIYSKLSSYKKKYNVAIRIKKIEYQRLIEQIKFTNEVKNIHNILLTGVTGHLGNHILYQLLYNTSYKIYLLVRSVSKEDAYKRVGNKFKFYFDIDLDTYKDRITIFTADIEKPDLQLSAAEYKELTLNVDSVIHSAALIKHYGDYTTFYQTNVQATINLLELSKLTNLKDFHYISTLSVLSNGYVPNHHYYVFTENDNKINLKNSNNIYSQTKYEGELAAIKYREYGVNSNIYRLGNLSMNSKNYRNQENIGENAFFIRVKTVLNLGIIPKEISEVEISPVDQAALAIVKLFDKSNLNCQTHHIANQYSANLYELLRNYPGIKIKFTGFNKFVEKILIQLNNNSSMRKQIELFMLHQSWLEDIDLENLTRIIVLQDKTNYILSNLDFHWQHISSNMLSDIIRQAMAIKNDSMNIYTKRGIHV